MTVVSMKCACVFVASDEVDRRSCPLHATAPAFELGDIAHGPEWQLANADCLAEDGMRRLGDGVCDLVLTDPPFGKRTHEGQKHKRKKATGNELSEDGDLGYDHLTDEQLKQCSTEFARLSRGWVLVMCDHELARDWEAELKAAGLYTFAPLPIVTPGMNVRLAGDGPSSWTVWLIVARHRTTKRDSTLGGPVKWGTKPGWYQGKRPAGAQKAIKGAKHPDLLEAIVRDYTTIGETVCDPFAGSGSTGVACIQSGRKFMGWELNTKHFALATRLIGSAKWILTIDDRIEREKRRPPQGEQRPLTWDGADRDVLK
jgi:site-specific DNA-methyltransferase (adenine-specific)